MSRHLPYSDLPIQQDTILVLIPALDEQNTIGSVIEELKQIGLNHIRVVDNGSSDKTVEVAKMTGAEVMFEKRRGYGQACWMGLQNIPFTYQNPRLFICFDFKIKFSLL